MKETITDISRYFNSRYFHELPNGEFRDPTSNELIRTLAIQQKQDELQRRIDLAEKELETLLKDCKHEVCYDTAAFPYDIRHCVACGHTSIL